MNKMTTRTAVLALLMSLCGAAAAQQTPETCRVFDPELKSYYYGPCENGLAHGEGQASGDARYRGGFKAGRKHGKGVKIWPSGDTYSGDFVEDRKHGRGVYTWGRGRNEGERYEGEYRDDRRHGQGTYRWPNGDVYEGPWVADRIADENAPVLRSRAEQLASGPYFGVLAGRGFLTEACFPPCDTSNSAYGLFFGYQFNRFLSLEAGFHSLGEFKVAGTAVTAGAAELVGILALPFGHYAPYLKAGVFKGEMSTPTQKESSANATLGAGLQYDWPSWALRMEYVYYRDMGGPNAGIETAVDRISLGLVLKFR